MVMMMVVVVMPVPMAAMLYTQVPRPGITAPFVSSVLGRSRHGQAARKQHQQEYEESFHVRDVVLGDQPGFPRPIVANGFEGVGRHDFLPMNSEFKRKSGILRGRIQDIVMEHIIRALRIYFTVRVPRMPARAWPGKVQT